jgi:hypothetical protein
VAFWYRFFKRVCGLEIQDDVGEWKNTLLRIYSEDMKDGNGIKIRKERQEYPGIRLDAAIQEKLGT